MLNKNILLEKNIETQITKYAKVKGFLTYKFTSMSNRGVPDRIFISPFGDIFFIEFKRANNNLTPLQQNVINKMTNNKCEVYLVDNISSGIKIIDKYINDIS